MTRTSMHRTHPLSMRGNPSLALCCAAAMICLAGATSNNGDQHVAAVAERRSLLREGGGGGHPAAAAAATGGASPSLSEKLARHFRRGLRALENVFDHVDDKVIEAQKGYCGSVNPNKDCAGKKNAKNNSGSGSGDASSGSDDASSSGSSDIGVSDTARAIMSVVKDSGKDKSIDLKKLRDKVQKELDVSSDDSSDFNDMFKDALDKLEGKGDIKIKDGVVKAIQSGDHSQDEKKKDKDDDDDDDDKDDDDDDDDQKDNNNNKDPPSGGGDGDDASGEKQEKPTGDDDDGDDQKDNNNNKDPPSGGDDDDASGGEQEKPTGDDDDGDDQNPDGDSTTDTGKGAIGDECQRNRDCESNMCSDGVCDDPPSGGGDDDTSGGTQEKPTGDDDDGDNQNPDGDSTTDTGKGAIGDECQRNSDCEPNMCSDGVCSKKMSGIGEECASDSDCESGVCGSEGSCEESRTVDTTDKGVVGATCKRNGDCASKRCTDGLCSKGMKANGKKCEDDAECLSKFCGTEGLCDFYLMSIVSNDGDDDDTESKPAQTPAPAPSGGNGDGGDSPREVESYSGDLSIPYNFQISNGGEELTAGDIADIDEALGILSQQVAEETFPDGGKRRLSLRRAFNRASGSSRNLLVVYNENMPAEVTDVQKAECLLSTDPGPCYDMDAETTLTLVDEDRGMVREEFRDGVEDAIADGLLTQILQDINPDTMLVATAEPSGGRDSTADGSQEPGEGGGATTRGANLSPGGIAGIAVAAAGVTAAVALFLISSRRRNDDDEDPLASSDDDSSYGRSSSKKKSTRLHEDASLRRLRAAAAAAGSTQQPGVYPDSYHQDSARMKSSTRSLNPELQESSVSSDDEEPTGAPGSFPTEAPPMPSDNASTPLIAAAAVAGGAALAAQYQGIVDESSTDHSMYEDDAQLQDSYDSALDAQIMSAAGKMHDDAGVDQILTALPAGAQKDGESPDSSFEDDIRAAISSMEGDGNGRDVSPERELPDGQYSTASEPESEKEAVTKKEKPSGLAGLIKKLSSQNMGGEGE